MAVRASCLLRWVALVAAILLVLVAPHGSPEARADQIPEYLLAPQDKLSVRVGQWDREEGIYKSWDALGGTYTVGPDGAVSMPLIGPVAASGQTVSGLADELSRRLAEVLGLTEPLGVAVEIEEYRPVFVLGAVETPGAHPWAPGMRVLEAIGLAGGLRRISTVYLRTDRDALQAAGEAEVHRLALWRALAAEARVEAELAGGETVELPDELAAVPVAGALIEIERELFEARRIAFQSSVEELESLEELIERRIATLGEQIVLRERQVQLAREELGRIETLTEQGLARAATESAVAQKVAELESSVLDLETARLEAELAGAEARRDRLGLANDRRRDLVTELGEIRAEIDRVGARIRIQEALFAEATRLGEGLAAEDALGEPVLTVTRMVDGAPETVPASRTTALEPGDVIEVTLPGLPDAAFVVGR